jgi:hypothetical protein
VRVGILRLCAEVEECEGGADWELFDGVSI